MYRSAHSLNVEPSVGLLEPAGAMPSASLARASAANSRARAMDTSRAEPNPISLCFPCQRNRNVQRRPPLGEIER
jgi:hypothetical protein